MTNALLGRIFHGLPLQTAVDLPRKFTRNPPAALSCRLWSFCDGLLAITGLISRNSGSASIETAMCVQWPSVCTGLETLGKSSFFSLSLSLSLSLSRSWVSP